MDRGSIPETRKDLKAMTSVCWSVFHAKDENLTLRHKKHSQIIKPSVAHLYPSIDRVSFLGSLYSCKRINRGTAFQLSINTIHRLRRFPSLQRHLQFIWGTIFARYLKITQAANCFKLTCRIYMLRRSLHIQLWNGLRLFTRSWLKTHRSIAFAFTFQTHQRSTFYRLLGIYLPTSVWRNVIRSI